MPVSVHTPFPARLCRYDNLFNRRNARRLYAKNKWFFVVQRARFSILAHRALANGKDGVCKLAGVAILGFTCDGMLRRFQLIDLIRCTTPE